MHHDLLHAGQCLLGLHSLNPGEKPCATRIWDLTTTALYNPEIAALLRETMSVDLGNLPKDWLSLEQDKYYGYFLKELEKYEVNQTDSHNSLLLLDKDGFVLHNDGRLLHGRASHEATAAAFPDQMQTISENGKERMVARYVTPLKASTNHLASLRLHTLESLQR
jgi:hypothetical protein